MSLLRAFNPLASSTIDRTPQYALKALDPLAAAESDILTSFG